MFDVEQFLKDYHIPSTTDGPNAHRGWIQICCPFCGDNNWHGGFKLSTGSYNCWKCKWHPVMDVIAQLLNCSKIDAYHLFQQYIKFDKYFYTKKSKFLGAKTIQLPKGCCSLFGQYRKYLEGRNFDPDFLERKYDLQASGHLGNYKFRIIAPINFSGHLVSYQGRDITDYSSMRWKACKKKLEVMHHKHILYNLDNCRTNSIIVVEGASDVWRMGDDCGATFGTVWTPEQANLLVNRFTNVHLLYDPESEAQKQARRLATEIARFRNHEVRMWELEKGDPAELSDAEAQYIKKQILG